MLAVWRDGDNRRALGCTIALHYAESHVLPAFGQPGRQVRTSTHEETEMAAKTFMDAAKEQAPPGKRQMRGHTLEQLKGSLFLLAPYLALNTIHKKLQGLGHKHHAGNLL